MINGMYFTRSRARKTHLKLDEVIPGKLYISDFESAQDKTLLYQYRIQTVINLSQKSATHHGNIKYMHLPMPDGSAKLDLKATMLKLERLIEENPRVLVHCHHGKSRSAFAVMAFLMLNRGMSFADAKLYLQEKRPQIALNFQFETYLMSNQGYMRAISEPKQMPKRAAKEKAIQKIKQGC